MHTTCHSHVHQSSSTWPTKVIHTYKQQGSSKLPLGNETEPLPITSSPFPFSVATAIILLETYKVIQEMALIEFNQSHHLCTTIISTLFFSPLANKDTHLHCESKGQAMLCSMTDQPYRKIPQNLVALLLHVLLIIVHT